MAWHDVPPRLCGVSACSTATSAYFVPHGNRWCPGFTIQDVHLWSQGKDHRPSSAWAQVSLHFSAVLPNSPLPFGNCYPFSSASLQHHSKFILMRALISNGEISILNVLKNIGYFAIFKKWIGIIAYHRFANFLIIIMGLTPAWLKPIDQKPALINLSLFIG